MASTTAPPAAAPVDPAVAGTGTLPARPSRAKIVFPALAILAATAGGGYYVHGIGRESTDDAQVEGHVVAVAARVSGQVRAVLVSDNQTVHEGDVLVELDPADYEVKVASADADLEAAKAALLGVRAQLSLTESNTDATLKQAKGGLTEATSTYGAARATIEQAEADVVAASSRLRLADSDLERARPLAASGSISPAELDSRASLRDQAKAALDLSRARLGSAKAGAQASSGTIAFANGRLASALAGPAQIEAARAAVSAGEARVKQAAAALSLAQLNLSFTKIKAPRGGQIARRTVEAGQMVGPDRALLAVIPLEDVWVVANFKEDQLSDVTSGQPVSVEVDTFSGHAFRGHVDSIAGASGARFALIPPDNATGNFIKVVQRIPVLIRFDGTDGLPLRPGMSAEVTVFTKAAAAGSVQKP